MQTLLYVDAYRNGHTAPVATVKVQCAEGLTMDEARKYVRDNTPLSDCALIVRTR